MSPKSYSGAIKNVLTELDEVNKSFFAEPLSFL